jgi:hypothetical protein
MDLEDRVSSLDDNNWACYNWISSQQCREILINIQDELPKADNSISRFALLVCLLDLLERKATFLPCSHMFVVLLCPRRVPRLIDS